MVVRSPSIAPGQRSQRVEIETYALLVVTVACAAFANLFPSIGTVPGVFSLVGPLVYIVVEARARGRSWEDLGIRFHGFVAGVVSNWWLFLLEVVVLQAASVAVAKLFLPSELAHVSGRIPAFGDLLTLVPLILVLTLREELVFRGLFQERVGWFANQVVAVTGVSAMFALTHVAPGLFAIVAVDVLFVFFDSLVYGVLYSRTRNIFVSWAAHAGADLVGLAILMWALS